MTDLSTGQACLRTGMTWRQLQYSSEQGILKPRSEHGPGGRDGKIHRWNEQELFVAAVLKELRDRRLSRPEIDKAFALIRKQFDTIKNSNPVYLFIENKQTRFDYSYEKTARLIFEPTTVIKAAKRANGVLLIDLKEQLRKIA